jgi:hypothetical protein
LEFHKRNGLIHNVERYGGDEQQDSPAVALNAPVEIDLGECCGSDGKEAKSHLVKVHRLKGETKVCFLFKECSECAKGCAMFLALVASGVWPVTLRFTGIFISFLFYLSFLVGRVGRAIHFEVFGLQIGLRTALIKVADEALWYFVNSASMISTEQILHKSLANVYGKIAPHCRSAHRALEHGWFLDSFKGTVWSCMCCSMTPEQNKLCTLRTGLDGHFSCSTLDHGAQRRRDENQGRIDSHIISERKVNEFHEKNPDVPTSSCGNSLSGSSSSGKGRIGRDVNAIVGSNCTHGLMHNSILIKSGELLAHSAILLDGLVEKSPWQKNGVLSYDMICTLKGMLAVFTSFILNSYFYSSQNSLKSQINILRTFYPQCTHLHMYGNVLSFTILDS